MKLSPLELLLGATTFSVATWMLQHTVAALRNSGTIVFPGAFSAVMATFAPDVSNGVK
jgi:hypothetical protein